MSTLPWRRSKLMYIVLSIFASVILLAAVPAFAQEVPGGRGAALPFMIMMAVAALAYVYFSIALQAIAKKVHADNDWWAWIPILQIVLTLNIARKPLWWLILCFVPFLNLVMLIIIWMGVAEAVGKPSWWGILLIVPLVNLIVPGYLAWSNSTVVPARDPLS